MESTVSSEHDDMTDAYAEAITRSSLEKRKAEIQDLKDSGDSGSSGESEMEEGGAPTTTELTGSGSSSPTKISDEESKEWEWGYDSFEGRECRSPAEDEYSEEEENEKKRRYLKKYFGSKGFYIDSNDIPRWQMGGIHPISDEFLDTCYVEPGKTIRQHEEEMSKLALQIYNEKNGTNVIFDRMVRVNMGGSTKVKSYITIMAKESLEGPLKEYQVKLQRWIMEKDRPIFCRPSPEKTDVSGYY